MIERYIGEQGTLPVARHLPQGFGVGEMGTAAPQLLEPGLWNRGGKGSLGMGVHRGRLSPDLRPM